MKRITKDFETRSAAELKKVGAYKYSLHPSTQPTCLAFKVRGENKVYFLDFFAINRMWADQPELLRTLWQGWIDDGYEFSAHNSFFERCIYDNILVKRYGWPKIPPRRRRCTAAKAAACALPRNLEGAGEAMKLRIQKDKRGFVAMMATCKPTAKYKAWGKMSVEIGKRRTLGKDPTPKQKKWLEAKPPKPPMFLEPLTLQAISDVLAKGPGLAKEPSDLYKRAATWNTLYVYCKFDVRSEEELDESLPDLSPTEQDVWHFNQKLNWRGIEVDVPTVKKITQFMAEEAEKKLVELDSITMGLVTKPGARKSIIEFLALEGIELPNLRSKTIDDALSGFELSEDMHRLLEIRKALTMTSTKKYYSMLERAAPDGRIRDILMYHGASTGRDTGTGLQPHNFPRGLIKIDKNRPYAAVENVVELDGPMLRLLYGESLAMLFSALLRNMIVPGEGYELFVADFSKIEVVVLWWLADNVHGLNIIRSGKDPYKYQAAANTGRDYEDISDEGDDRQLGKAQILGCGFGMGAPKFQTTAWDMYRLKLTIEQSRLAVSNYRETHSSVPELWKTYERAAVAALETGKVITAGKCKFFVKDKFLWVELPSGRRLAYREPQIEWRESEYGPRKTLEFWGVNSKTKKWALERTWGGTLTENIVQAVARDLMMYGMVRLEKKGYEGLLMVHDEAITRRLHNQGALDEFTETLCEVPAWAPGLPLDAKGWRGHRYRK